MSTLAQLRDMVEIVLQDGSNATWTTAELDAAIRQALGEINLWQPRRLAINGLVEDPEYMLNISDVLVAKWSTFATECGPILAVRSVQWPFDNSTAYENKIVAWRAMRTTANQWMLIIDQTTDNTVPEVDDEILFDLDAQHTVSSLDSYTVTSLLYNQEALLVQLAAAFAAISEATDLASLHDRAFLREWGDETLQAARKLMQTLSEQERKAK